MKNSILLVGSAVVITLFLAGYILLNQNKNDVPDIQITTPELNTPTDPADPASQTTPTAQTTPASQTTPAVKSAPDSQNQKASYVSFSPDALANSANTRRVLFFYANWCPTCKPADASFTQNEAKIPADVTVIRVNYNDTMTDQAEKELAKQYGVTYQHTFVQIDSSGAEVTKWNGGKIDELLNTIQ